MAFLNDIKSKQLSTFVLVTIGDDIRISTQKITFDDKYYKPILLNVPSISESLDIEQRKYKISSVSLSISDYEEDGERFSDNLNTLMNKEVNIYYSSPSCSTFDDCYLAGTYIIRSFSQDEDKVTLNCEDLSQDKLQTEIPLQELGDDESILEKYRNKPIPMVFGEVDKSPCVLESKKIIFDTPDSTELAGTELDDIFTDKIKESLYIFDGDSSYSNVLKNIEKVLPKEGFSYVLDEIQWSSDDSSNGYVNLLNTRLSALNNLQVRRFSKSENPSLTREHLPTGMINQNNLIADSGNAEETIDNNFNTYVLVQDHYGVASDGSGGIVDGDFNPSTLVLFKYYKMVIPLILASDTDRNDIPEVALNRVRLPKPFPHLSEETDPDSIVNSTFFETNYDNTNIVIAGGSNAGSDNSVPYFIDNLHEHPDTELDYSSLFIFNEADVGNFEGEDSLGEAWEGQGTDIGFKDQSFPESSAAVGCFANENQFELIFFAKLPSTSLTSFQTYQADLIARIREIDTTFIADIKEPLKKNYFVHVIGRQGDKPQSQHIYSEILSELGINWDVALNSVRNVELGKYAFTINKKINSKKLIEELSQSTPLYPYFKDNQFKVKAIKKVYHWDETTLISSDDIIKYKYDRTKVEKVYNKVNVKYHYDYGLNDFIKETGDITPKQLMHIESDGNSHYVFNGGVYNEYNYNESYFGEDFDQELVFESKYIRDQETANNLAKYLCGLHANQHNIIHLTLPLNYLTLELGDIVRFDKLIQNRKIFGENYAIINPTSDIGYIRNGQTIYKYWFVEQIKKSLDKVEIKLYQLHQFNFDESIDYVLQEPEPEPTTIYYCGDPTAVNGQDSTELIDDDEFIYVQDNLLCVYDSDGDGVNDDDEIPGCTNPSALNYDSNATEDDGSCQFAGCTDPTAVNYDSNATHDDGSCIIPQTIYYCPLPNFAETYLANGDGENIEGLIGNPPENTTYIEDESLCSTPIDPNPETLGWCEIGGEWEGEISEFVCNNQFGNWQEDAPVWGCTDSNALNYISNAQVDNGSCLYPAELIAPTINSPTDGQIIEAEFTEATEEQIIVGGIPDYEIITDEPHRTFSLSTSEAHNTDWTDYHDSVELIHDDNMIGIKAHELNVRNRGIYLHYNGDNWYSNFIANNPPNTMFKVRAKIKVESPTDNKNVGIRLIGIYRKPEGESNPYPLTETVISNTGWTVHDFNRGNPLYIHSSPQQLKLTFYFGNEVNTEVWVDWMSFIPANEEYYDGDQGLESSYAPATPATIVSPSINVNFNASPNLNNPYGDVITALNTKHEVRIYDAENNNYYSQDYGSLDDSEAVSTNIDFDPFELPVNQDITVSVKAISDSNYHNNSEAEDAASFIWQDNTGNLVDVIEIGTGLQDDLLLIQALIFGTIATNSDYLALYDFDNNGDISTVDFAMFIEQNLEQLEEFGLYEGGE